MSKSNPEAIEVRLGAEEGFVFSSEGEPMKIPDGWDCLRPGDAALSRRLKMEGPSWTVIEFKRRKKFSHGILAPRERIERLQAERQEEKEDPKYRKNLEAGRSRSAKKQEAYAEDFENAVFQYLSFHEVHLDLANELAKAVADHAVPVGSGTVARTQRIPIEQRAESAVIAWMRHQTTAYDHMTIPREKGKRREVRRMLAKESKQLLRRYRESAQAGQGGCPLRDTLS